MRTHWVKFTIRHNPDYQRISADSMIFCHGFRVYLNSYPSKGRGSSPNRAYGASTVTAVHDADESATATSIIHTQGGLMTHCETALALPSHGLTSPSLKAWGCQPNFGKSSLAA